MATGYIDKYVFALMLDSTDFQKGANIATRAIGGLKSTLLKTYSAIGGIDLFKNLISTYTDAAKSVDRMSIVTNEDINSLQAWQKAISDTGGNVNAFNGTIRALSDDMAQLKNYGTSKYLSTMQWLGIDFTNEKGEIKSATELLLAYQKALAGMDNQTAWNFAQKLGLDEDTFALMRRHPDDLEKIIRQYKKMAIIGKEDIAINRQWEKVLSDFRYSWLRFSKTIGSNVLPILQNQLFPAIQEGINYLLSNQDEVKSFFGSVSSGVRTLLPVIVDVAKATGTFLGKVVDVTKALGEMIGTAQVMLEGNDNGHSTDLVNGLKPGSYGRSIWENAPRWAQVDDRAFGMYVQHLARQNYRDKIAQNTVNIQKIEINTPNGDPQTIANGIGQSLRDSTELSLQNGGSIGL